MEETLVVILTIDVEKEKGIVTAIQTAMQVFCVDLTIVPALVLIAMMIAATIQVRNTLLLADVVVYLLPLISTLTGGIHKEYSIFG